ncbi:MAG TPA: DnaJ family domain-containing protein [Steroidobacteraceae bacterium]
MDFIERLAEQRILAAMERGEFDNLPGAGKPLDLDDDANVPPELRVAYRILKNAGFVPPEVELRREIADAESLLVQALSPAERSAANRRLEFLLTKLSAMRGRARDARLEAAYYDKLADKLRARRGETGS